VVTGDGVVALLPGPVGWTVRLSSGRQIEADAVVLTCPAPDAARLLRAVSPGAAATLGSIDTASVVMTLLAYPGSAVAVPRPGSGFLVPRSERRLVTAASWVGAKWPHLASPDRLVVRASSGRIDDRRAMELDDDELVAAVQGELSSAMDLVGPPAEAQVHRWADAFPQYAPGHLDRIDQAERRLALDAPAVVLAGAALRGVGIATCIAGARAAAARVLGQVAARPAQR
jgi:oxygen-dependent protoporphyrinogen oxidase